MKKKKEGIKKRVEGRVMQTKQ